METESHTKSAPASSVQLLLWEIANKETDIFVRTWPRMAQYRDDLRSHIFVKIVSMLKTEVSSMDENEQRQYLKKSIQNQLARCARDITARERYSPLEFLNSVSEAYSTEEESELTLEEAIERIAYELYGLGEESPTAARERRELCALIEHHIQQADATVRQIVVSRLAGASIRSAAGINGLSKTTAARIIEKFAVRLRNRIF